MERSTADLVWNRAAIGEECTTLAKGDCALAALLRMHGLIMNGGVFNAVEVVTPKELNDAIAGYEYFGLVSVNSLFTRAETLVHSGAEIGSREALFDAEYNSVVPNDSFLISTFKKQFAADPNDFGPV